jgi:non-lysosomal glucosylceramidase
VIYESKGYWFRTPEAWDITGDFRAGMYMRPTAIWALEMTPPRAKQGTCLYRYLAPFPPEDL